jgi:hypothetical protein
MGLNPFARDVGTGLFVGLDLGQLEKKMGLGGSLGALGRTKNIFN